MLFGKHKKKKVENETTKNAVFGELEFIDCAWDGDYYFFIEENFEFGYLGHPWRQEIWIFGRDLIKEIEQVYLELSWKKLN